MLLAAYVQHHPDREELLPGLLARLGPSPVVVTDPDPGSALRSPWRTYRACLEAAALSDAPHALIVQDDCVPCPLGFWEAACRAATARPDAVLTLFVPGALRAAANRVLHAANAGRVWVPLDAHMWVPAVALIWPAPYIQPVLDWVDAQHWPEKFRADDEIIGRALRGIAGRGLACAPSLVQHPDEQPSLIGLRNSAGRDRGRVAACWIGACDPRTMDWDSGAK